MRIRRELSHSFIPRLTASMWVMYELILVTSPSLGFLGAASATRRFRRLLRLLVPVANVFVYHWKFRGRGTLSCKIFNLTYSSMIGLATQLDKKSAAKSVIRLGRYLFSLNTHGSTNVGTFGESLNMFGSHIAKTPRRTPVVNRISKMKARA